MVNLQINNPRTAATLPINVIIIGSSTTYFQSLALTLVANSIPQVVIEPIYDIGLKINLNCTNISVITGNNATSTDYEQHSYINITSPTNIGAYACAFGLFNSSVIPQLSGSWCKFINNSIIVGGYQQMIGLSSVEFVVLSTITPNQTYTVQITESSQYVASVVATGVASLLILDSAPPIASTINVSNVSYMGSLTIYCQVNSTDYLLIEFPQATSCCVGIVIDNVSLSSFVYVNTSTGLMINLKSVSSITSTRNLTILGLNLTSGFATGSKVKVTEFIA
jgi:hypothetical protein